MVVISILVSAALALSLLLSIALTILIYWDFTVRLEEERLVITRGLLERRKAQVPLRRGAIRSGQRELRSPALRTGKPDSGGGRLQLLRELGKPGEQHAAGSCTPGESWQVAAEALGTPLELDAVVLKRAPSRALTRRIQLVRPCRLVVLAMQRPRRVSRLCVDPIGSASAQDVDNSGGQYPASSAHVVRAPEGFPVGHRFHIPGARRRASNLEDEKP